ncbi:MAG: hypothetical protein ABI431_04260, partial [Candidatus Tumulicola sp.]
GNGSLARAVAFYVRAEHTGKARLDVRAWLFEGDSPIMRPSSQPIFIACTALLAGVLVRRDVVA